MSRRSDEHHDWRPMMGLNKLRNRLILVTGATGRQGGAVARQLVEAGFQVRAMTRNVHSQAAKALASAGIDILRGDFDDSASLRQALENISGVFAMQTPYESGTDREILHGIRLADAALQAGVSQIVYSSVASADLPTGVVRIRHHSAPGFLHGDAIGTWKFEGFGSRTGGADLQAGDEGGDDRRCGHRRNGKIRFFEPGVMA